MDACPFCAIVAGRVPAAIAYRDDRLTVFSDHAPIRPGHMQIDPHDHVEVFDDLAPALAARIVHLGQRIARAQKRLYGVRRVGFVFTGNDVPHVHAHVVPLHASTDVTSARYFEGRVQVRGAPRADAAEMAASARRLAAELGHPIGHHGPAGMA